MAVVRFDPFREMAVLQDRMHRVFGDVYGRREDDLMARGTWVPAVDIYQDGKEALILKAELPAMRREDIHLAVENNTLTLSGERQDDPGIRQEQYHRMERAVGSFSRSFSLPPTVDAGRISAEYKQGLLTVRLPMREEARPRTIDVTVG